MSATAYTIAVSLYNSEPRFFEFDQERVLIGRSAHADLQLRHAAASRRQLVIERVLQPFSGPRFRLVPLGKRNPTLLNGVVAIEGALHVGDLIAVGEVRLALVRRRREQRSSPRARLTLGLMAALALVTAVGLFRVATPRSRRSPIAEEKLFARLPTLTCPDAQSCAGRARQAYAHGKSYARQGGISPGNWYRATIAFYQALEFERQSGAAVDGLEDAAERLRRSAFAAELVFQDLQFRLARALEADDRLGLRQTVAELSAAVPDEEHPIRVKLADYLRAHPLPDKESSGEKKP
jgi:hypothetical protein